MATCSDNVWTVWTTATSSTSTCTSSFDPGGYVWESWASDSTATTTATNTNECVWVKWTSDPVKEKRYKQEYLQQPIPVLSQEEIDRRRERRDQERKESEERQKKYAEMERKREEAEKKAKALLLDLIGEDQLKVYEETGRVFVKGRKQDYIVQKRGEVIQIQKDKLVDMCVHLENRTKYPDTDNVVAMKLMLETDEDKVLELANQHEYTKRDISEMPLAACM